MKHLGIDIQEQEPAYINAFSKSLLEGFYLKENETVSQALARASTGFCYGDYGLAQRLYDAAYRGWFMFASPILSNAPAGAWVKEEPGPWDWSKQFQFFPSDPTSKNKGMPISCYSIFVGDTIKDQIDAGNELAALSVAGGGVGLHNAVRATTDKAPGPIPYMKTVDAMIGYYKQGKTRRGACAWYMDVDHPDVMEHIKFRIPTGGDSARKSDNRKQFHSAVNVTDKFIQAVLKNEDFDLVCPHTKEVRETVNARKLWHTILDTRALTGEPYIFKIDTANRALPQAQKDLGLRVNGSNICVTPETFILTDQGYVPIGELEDQVVNVWNGEEYSEVTVRCTGRDQPVLSVSLEDGRYINCTPGHRFYMKDGTVKTAQELKVGDSLEHWVNPDGVEDSDSVVFGVSDWGRRSDVFCFTEPKRGRGVFNGILTGQCIEITLPTNEDRTFVCCLSSLNLEKYDEWKDTNLVSDLVVYLDNVIQYFIDNAPDELAKAKYSATRERAIGLGTMGWHYYLQKHGIPFESGGFGSALQKTHQIFSSIKAQAEKMSLQLGAERGEAPDMAGTGRRNSHLLAVAPNSNNAIILGTSPSIEPISKNVFPHSTRAGTHEVVNPYFVQILERHAPEEGRDQWIQEQIQSAREHEGSVQHLDCLTDEEKVLLKTGPELDQHWVIEQADARQQYICQSQSLNLFFPAGVSAEYFNSVHLKALLAPNLKALYYARMERGVNADVVKKIERAALTDWSPEECVACSG